MEKTSEIMKELANSKKSTLKKTTVLKKDLAMKNY